ncbi:hypothetical protein HID58_038880 [Brassica napus]|uniref:Uncharacterized protein n=2 Tax=Brassica TaxID=3705 RepID=A0ABQ8BQR4_BRANA|nr:hypothetical protein HID58_038880 [Brassica napus]CAG7865126.1 unnamed protein product [Brassica rapa]VDC62230.1 unnamed protein product [Brassica rapa]
MANNPAKSTPTKKQGVGLYDGSLKRVAPSTALNHAQSGILIGLDLLFIGKRCIAQNRVSRFKCFLKRGSQPLLPLISKDDTFRVLSELHEQSLAIEFSRSGSIHPKRLKRVVFSELISAVISAKV